MAQTRRGRQDETTDNLKLSPDTTSSHESGTPGDEAFTIITSTIGTRKTIEVDPNITIMQDFISSLQVVPSPKEAGDLREFESAVTEILRRNPKTVPLLEPAGQDPGLNHLSTLIHNEIWARVPERLIGRKLTWNPDTYSLLLELRKLTPGIHKASQYKTAPPLYIFPTRKETETMIEYTIRFWLWKDRYLPFEHPKLAHYLASCIWVNHSQLYNVEILANQFDTVVETFKTTAEVVEWFKKQDMLQAPVAARMAYY